MNSLRVHFDGLYIFNISDNATNLRDFSSSPGGVKRGNRNDSVTL